MAVLFDRTFFLDLARIGAGSVFLVLGVLGLFLPVLQGILFLAVAAVLLAPYVPFFHRVKIILYRRFPKVRRQVQSWKKSFRRRFPANAARQVKPDIRPTT